MRMKTGSKIVLGVLTALFLLASCNADASAGLFRQIADSKTPTGIKYKQIIEYDGSVLAFLTEKGAYQYDINAGAYTVDSPWLNTKGKIKLTAYNPSDSSYYLYSANAGENGGINIYSMDGSDTQIQPTFPTPLFDALTDKTIRSLYRNGLFLLEGNAASTKTYALATLDSVSQPFAEFTNFTLTSDLADFDIDNLLFATGYELSDPASQPFIVSFVSEDGNYKHYYQDGAVRKEIVLNTRLANFATDGTNTYLLTTDGKLYSFNVGTGDVTQPSKSTTSKVFAPNAFMFAITEGSTTHLVTKQRDINESVLVLSFATDGSGSVTTKSIRSGYAQHLSNGLIVSSHMVSPNELIVATYENGIFRISITDADSDSDSNGNSVQII